VAYKQKKAPPAGAGGAFSMLFDDAAQGGLSISSSDG
jgi:hypothetical protein